MKNNQKNLFKRLITGLKQGWNAPVLPNKVLNLHNNILVRIFRVLGGVSIVTVLSKKHLLLYFPLNYIVLLIALLHFIYITVIIIKLGYGFKVLISDKLIVKNSPLDRFATTAGKLLYCWKYGSQVGSAGLGLVGTSFMIDSILEAGDKEKIFTPLPIKGVKLFVNGKSADQTLIDIKSNIKKLENSKKTFEQINDLFSKAEGALDSKDFSKQDIDSIKSTIS